MAATIQEAWQVFWQKFAEVAAKEHIPERSPAVNQHQASSDNTARGHMHPIQVLQDKLPASDTTSEEDNDDMAPNAADDDDADDADAVSSDKVSVDDDVTRTEKYLRLYFNSLAKLGTICTVEEEFNLVTTKLGLILNDKNSLSVIRICPNKGLLHKFCSMKWKYL